MDFRRATPNLLVVDDFYLDPDAVRDLALEQTYHRDLDYFKGERSTERFLFPWVREEFSRLLQKQVVSWTEQNANGVFQKTTVEDSLVYHHDSQTHAAAIYLTPDAPMDTGTTFLRTTTHGTRRRPDTAEEREVVYDPYNLEHSDVWEAVDTIGAVYNRLVIWDASLIHCATSYPETERLVQLFFFDAA